MKSLEETKFNRKMMYRLVCTLIILLVAMSFIVVFGGLLVWWLTNEIRLADDGSNRMVNSNTGEALLVGSGDYVVADNGALVVRNNDVATSDGTQSNLVHGHNHRGRRLSHVTFGGRKVPVAGNKELLYVRKNPT